VDVTPERAKTDVPYAAGSPEATTERVLAICRHRWESAGLARADIDDMLAELSSHLAAAAERGRAPEDVLGPDLEKVARDWAQARAPRRQRWPRLTVYALAALSVYLLVTHLWQTTTEVDITPGFLLYVVGMIGINLWWRPRGRPVTFQRVLLVSAILLVPLVLVDALLWPDTVLFRVPLWITAPAAVASFVAAWSLDRRGGRRPA
jgi:hypothetical protein